MLAHERASLVLIYDLYIRNFMHSTEEKYDGNRVVIRTEDDVYPHKELTFKIDKAKHDEIYFEYDKNYHKTWIERPSSRHKYEVNIEPHHTDRFTMENLDSKHNAVAYRGTTAYYLKNVGTNYTRRVEIVDRDDSKTYTYVIEIDGDKLGRSF